MIETAQARSRHTEADEGSQSSGGPSARPSLPRRLIAGSTGDADNLKASGFEGVLAAPFGRVLDADQLERFTPATPTDLVLVVQLPWQRHREASSLVKDQPDWFEAADASGVIDPRRLAGLRGRRVNLSSRGVQEAYAEWIASQVAKLGNSGAQGVFLPEIDNAPEGFWQSFQDELPATSPFLFAGTSKPQVDDNLGFHALVSNRAGLSCDRLATPLIAGELHGAVEVERLLVQGAVTHDGFILSARQATDLGANRLREIAELYDRFERKGSVQIRRLGQRSFARFDDDPRRANHAAAFGTDRTSVLRILGGRFSSMTSLFNSNGHDLTEANARRAGSSSASDDGLANLKDLAPQRIAIEDVYPLIDGGRFPAKRIVGDVLEVGADIFCDGHEKLAADLLVTEPGQEPRRFPMEPAGNDRYRARAPLSRMGVTHFDIEAWRDRYATWRDEVSKKRKAGQNVRLETIEGRDLVLPQLKKVTGNSKDRARTYRQAIEEADEGSEKQLRHLLDEGLGELLRQDGEHHQAVRLSRPVEVQVDREQARFSAWYELFPRSMSGDENRHGTFRDVIDRLPYIRDLGFDVLYFPPIHPIGKTNRKGRNNTLTPDEEDVGSPYAIGSADGGHTAIHPQLGTFEDFAALIDAAAEHGLEIALDFAIQCSPDHPWLKEHEEWFDWRPDGTIKFAENPPKKYEDIVNVHFYRDAIPDLWYALRDVVLFWCEKGVRMFRVDNPHTKPYPFWEWMIGEVKKSYPDALFLSEAFTRPKVMKRLAKLGFTQSYTYYTWRNTKDELAQYMRELTETTSREVMNPNFFVNTPDINPPVLQSNNRDAHIARTWLAGTLASSYGIYNGVEIAEGTPLPGKEEYLDSEKYQIRVWDMDRDGHIKDEIRLLNRLRQEHPALRDHVSLRLLTAHNDKVMWYAKATPDYSDVVLFAVSLDFDHDQRATVEVPLWFYGLSDDASIEAYDVFADQHFTWKGKMQEVTLGPGRIVRAFVLKAPKTFSAPDEVLYADREGFR